VLLAVFLRRHQYEVGWVVVERVVIIVVHVHSRRYGPVHVREDVPVKVSASATARSLVVHALRPVVAARIPLVRNALVHDLSWWIHKAILSISDALLLAFYSGTRMRVRWL
jgi:hypothetical protein